MTAPLPHRIAIPQDRLHDVLRRLADAHWPDIPANPPGTDGIDPALVRRFADHVTTTYDWRAQEAALNALPSFVAEIDGAKIHFLHYAAASPTRAIMLIHGWPGGYSEFIEVAERLAHPERFGGHAAQAWSVIIPSLPGFGLSSKPAVPIGPRHIAGLFDTLMRDVLGYQSYIAQGGDWGSTIASWLGYLSPACTAIHLNFHLGWAMGAVKPATEPEIAAATAAGRFMAQEGAYIRMQATKPLTLSYAMADSPLGAAAWIIEKFNDWSDLRGENLWTHFDRDRLTTLIMLYLLTDSFGTASWIYRGMYNDSERVPPGIRVAKPTGIAVYPAEIGAYPRSMVEQAYDIVHWAEPPRGGHFAAFEQPELFAADINTFGQALPQPQGPAP